MATKITNIKEKGEKFLFWSILISNIKNTKAKHLIHLKII